MLYYIYIFLLQARVFAVGFPKESHRTSVLFAEHRTPTDPVFNDTW